MEPLGHSQNINRRQFLQHTGTNIGVAALAMLTGGLTCGASAEAAPSAFPNYPARAKRVIYLFQSGAPSQLELFDYKPSLDKLHMTELPSEIRMGQRLTGMTSGQSKFPCLRSKFPFAQHGNSGAWMSDRIPYTAGIADDLCIVRSMHTEAINHDPAITFVQTGSQLAGRPSIGAWPRSSRQMLDQLRTLNLEHFNKVHDPEIKTRIDQYELAFRMQTTVPDLTDISGEPDHILDMYGPDVRTPGTFARNCLLARRLAERDVRFVQLFHMGWDHHNDLPDHLTKQCRDTDQASAALVKDLKQRGLLEDTLVIWGGEFGRTVYSQGQITETAYGRDHHPRCYSIWMAGGGIKPGYTHGVTDDFSYNIVQDPVHVHDLNATILHTLGIDHRRLSTKFQGLNLRLTGVEDHNPVQALLA